MRPEQSSQSGAACTGHSRAGGNPRRSSRHSGTGQSRSSAESPTIRSRSDTQPFGTTFSLDRQASGGSSAKERVFRQSYGRHQIIVRLLAANRAALRNACDASRSRRSTGIYQKRYSHVHLERNVKTILLGLSDSRPAAFTKIKKNFIITRRPIAQLLSAVTAL